VRFNLAHPADRPRNQPCEDDASVCVVPFPYPNRGGIKPAARTSALIPEPTSPAANDRAADLIRRAQRLEDEQSVLNLQHTFGYHVDRGAWKQAADLFAPEGSLEVGQAVVYVGRKHIRRALALTAPKGLRPGQRNDHLQFEPIVDIAPDGQSAQGRIFELAFVGGGGQPARIIQNVHENEYVRRAGEWMIASVHSYTILVTDYAQGWAKSALPAPAASTALPPDHAPTVSYEPYPKVYTPPFHFKRASAASNATRVASVTPVRIAAAERQVQRAMDYDEIENLQNAYGYYAEKSLWSDVAALFADDGVLEIDNVRHAGREHILADLKVSGPEGPVKGALNSLLQLQPVIHIGRDGRTATMQSRYLQLTRDAQGRPMWGAGIYENELVKRDGTWKFKRLHVRRTYQFYYKDGWATP
jgi:hypothetical protein